MPQGFCISISGISLFWNVFSQIFPQLAFVIQIVKLKKKKKKNATSNASKEWLY